MKATKQFIEDAIEGGWKDYMNPRYDTPTTKVTDGVWFDPKLPTIRWVPIHEILLDPLAWQAVGKVRGWKENWTKEDSEFSQLTCGELIKLTPKYKIKRFIDALWEGKTIEQALQSI